MRDFGLTAVSTYVPWNLHESKKGEFNFENNADIVRFIKTADECGLKVILRLSPYLCGEWEMGRLPPQPKNPHSHSGRGDFSCYAERFDVSSYRHTIYISA